MRTHPALFAALAVLGAVLAVLVAAETALRIAGQRPGILTSARFEIREHAEPVAGLIADDEGVLKYDPSLRERIAVLVGEHSARDRIQDVFGAGYEYSIREMVASFARSDADVDYDNEFNAMIDRLRARAAAGDVLTRLERAYLAYSRQPLNTDGFRSIELERFASSEATRVLLLGDSFTWGFSARPLTSSFADVLAAEGYAVYNTGITAIGPAQYEHLAAKYVPLLEPDVVIVNFYLANDVVFWERELEPGQFPQYPTNVGFIAADPKGEYLRDVDDAYAYTLQSYVIPDRDRLVFNDLCARTVLGTRLWSVLARAGLVARRSVAFAAYDERNAGVGAGQPVSERHIARIRDVAERHGARFILAVIPDLLDTVGHDYEAADVFEELSFHVPDVQIADYRPAPDAHFNNRGHRKYARFLRELIEAPAAGDAR